MIVGTLVEVFVDRMFQVAVDGATVCGEADAARATFESYGVTWQRTLLARGGRRALCQVSAADAGAVRGAFRVLGLPMRGLWSAPPGGCLHSPANVAVERYCARRPDTPPVPDWCLATHRVRFAGQLISHDRLRVIELFAAPDAESVRLARGSNAEHGDRVWAFEVLHAADLPKRC